MHVVAMVTERADATCEKRNQMIMSRPLFHAVICREARLLEELITVKMGLPVKPLEPVTMSKNQIRHTQVRGKHKEKRHENV